MDSADFAAHSAHSVVYALSQGALLASILAGAAAVLDNVAYGNCDLGRGLWTVRLPLSLSLCCKSLYLFSSELGMAMSD